MAEPGREHHDGRFGAGFDDEISVGGLGQIGLGLAAACVLAIVIVWLMLRGDSDAAGNAADAAAVEQALPSGPRLQTHPEDEYRQMRRELDEHVHGYGWVDEGTGAVYIPIDRAIDLVLEQGVDGRAKVIAKDVPAEEPR
jgi:hypothetical protein